MLDLILIFLNMGSHYVTFYPENLVAIFIHTGKLSSQAELIKIAQSVKCRKFY